MIDLEKVRKAAMLYLLSPCRGGKDYEDVDMMIYAGVPKEFAQISLYRMSFESEYKALEQQVPKSVRQSDRVKRQEHFKEIYKIIPDMKVSFILKMIGCKQDEIFAKRDNGGKGGTTLWQNCYNHTRRLEKKAKNPLAIVVPLPTEAIDLTDPSPMSAITDSCPSVVDLTAVTVLSTSSTPVNCPLDFSSSKSSSKGLLYSSNSSSSESNTITSETRIELPELILGSGRKKSIERYFTTKVRRQST